MSGTAADQRGIPRAAVLATFTAALAAVGHLAGGGALPDLTMLVVLLPLLGGGIVTVAERTRSALGTILVLALGQLALHELIGLLNPTHPPHAGHQALGVPGGAQMLIMHAAATLITAAGLRYADRALAVLGAALRRVLPRRPPALPADRPLTTLALPGPAVSLRLARALAAALVRRGPPVRC